MIKLESLGLTEAQKGLDAALAAAEAKGRKMAFAVVDVHGELIACARMDGAHPRILKHAIRKAFTAATYGRNTLVFKKELADSNRELLDWGDLNVTTLQGGYVVKSGGQVVGGVGSGGGTLEIDEEMARVIIRAMGFEPDEGRGRNGHAPAAVSGIGPAAAKEQRVAQRRKVTYTQSFPEGGRLPVGFDPDTMAVQMGSNLYTTGIYGVNPKTGQLGDDPERQFDLAYRNMVDLVEKAGLTTDEIGLVTVYLPGPDYRQYINKGWLEVFPDENNRPARKTNHVNLPDGVYCQLQAVAVAGGRRQRLEVEGLAHRDPIPNGVKIGNMIFSSVIVPQDLATAKTVEGPIEQIRQCFDNTRVFMEKAGASLDDVIHMWTFMSDFKYQPDMVDLWVKTWPVDGDRPARKTLRYPMAGLIQVQATGVAGGKRTNYEIPGVGHHDPIPMGAKIGNIFYSSGISGVEPDPNGRRIDAVEGLEPQIQWCEYGAKTLLEQAGGGLDDLAMMTVLISDWSTIPVVKRHWDRLFPDPDNRPALKFIDYRMPGRSHVQYHVTAVF